VGLVGGKRRLFGYVQYHPLRGWDQILIASLGAALESASKPLAIHLALSALSRVQAKQITQLTDDVLTKEALAILPQGKELPEEWEVVVGEMYVVLISFRERDPGLPPRQTASVLLLPTCPIRQLSLVAWSPKRLSR